MTSPTVLLYIDRMDDIGDFYNENDKFTVTNKDRNKYMKGGKKRFGSVPKPMVTISTSSILKMLVASRPLCAQAVLKCINQIGKPAA